MSQNVAVVTLGCEKNVVDSEIMMGLMTNEGYTIIDDPSQADVIIVNTCGFIDAAKEESIETILTMAGHKLDRCKKLLVTGCLAQRYQDELITEMPEIDGMLGTGEFHRINELVGEAMVRNEKPRYFGNPVYLYDETTPRMHGVSGATAYLKIAEGCDHACTFCIIPQLRGKFRSRSVESIVSEARALVNQGVKEISLIAQDLTQYGLDVYGKRSLPQLLTSLNEVEGLEWIRLHYVYPGHFTDELLEAIATLPKVCKYIDMPLQHSEDHILKAMQRPGRQRQIRALMEKIRSRVPDVSVRTSIIVGFPGETDQDFENLTEFVREMAFDHVGVFTYSQEEGTKSALLDGQVPQEVKEARSARLMEIARQVAARRNERFVGRTLPVLLERRSDEHSNVWIGRTQYDAREIDGQVFVSGLVEAVAGSMVNVRITHSYDFDLAGEGM